MNELSEHRIAVTVFCTTRAVDYSDACSIAEMAVRHTLQGRRPGEVPKRLPADIALHIRGETIPVQVHDVKETGIAAGNGYLWTQATPKAYRELE